MTTVESILREATARLQVAGVDTPRLDGELLLAHVLGQPRRWLWSYGETEVSARQRATFTALLVRRIQREPLAYIIGEWEFYGRAFLVNSTVLIPRPETELLVEAVLSWLDDHVASRVVDVGVGSGAIAVTLAIEAPQLQLIAVDIAADTLLTAQANARRHGVNEARLRWLKGDLLLPVQAEGLCPVDVIVANLPYIAETDTETLMPEVGQYEPPHALFAGVDGLAQIRRLIAGSPDCLAPGGLLALEVGDQQAAQVVDWLRQSGWRNVHAIDDYSGIPRHVLAERGGNDRC